jgi:NAD(P)H-nitrite reductase large subunit
MNVDFDTIKIAVAEVGTNMDAVMQKTKAGTACGCCKNDECPKVDLPLPKAILKAS